MALGWTNLRSHGQPDNSLGAAGQNFSSQGNGAGVKNVYQRYNSGAPGGGIGRNCDYRGSSGWTKEKDSMLQVIQMLISENQHLKKQLDLTGRVHNAEMSNRSQPRFPTMTENMRSCFGSKDTNNRQHHTGTEESARQGVQQEMQHANTKDGKSEKNSVKFQYMNSSKARWNKKTLNDCMFCGINHRWGIENCSAHGSTCRVCKKKNHFAEVCFYRDKKVKRSKSLPNMMQHNLKADANLKNAEENYKDESVERITNVESKFDSGEKSQADDGKVAERKIGAFKKNTLKKEEICESKRQEMSYKNEEADQSVSGEKNCISKVNKGKEKLAEKIEVPDGMDETKEDSIAWVEFRDTFKTWLSVSKTAEENENRQCCWLLNQIGNKGYDMYNTFGLEVEDLNSLDDLINRFDKAFLVKGKKKRRKK